MSFLGKKWVLKDQGQSGGLFEVLLNNRGIGEEERQNYLSDELKLHDPFLFADMKKAVERILEAIEKQERIIIFGDYDVDGISGTAILVHTLRKLKAQVSYRLPHRTQDGYGLSNKFVNDFKEAQAKVLITVDCGISNIEQIKAAQKAGIDVIISDHHTVPPEKPPAYAIIHPLMSGERYPFKGLTGSGVAFKLAQGLFAATKTGGIENMLDLASLGTVADMGPLQGENRAIVKKGLKLMEKTNWRGLELLKEISGAKRLDSTALGFQICPRINAAGRIASPYLALQLLLHENEQENSKQLAKELERLNIERRRLTEQAVEELEAHIAELNDPQIIIKENSNWHVGIVGLIAGRISEKYSLPAIILQDFGEHLVGSCRSPEFFNVTEALTAHKDLLEVYGGHPQAAGFTILKKNYDDFLAGMLKYAGDKMKGLNNSPQLDIDCELPESFLNISTLDLLDKMEPFGISNEKPVFLLSDCEIDEIKTIGNDNRHLKLRLKKGGTYVDSVGFSFGNIYQILRRHKKISIAAHLERNHWNGKDNLQLRLVDIKKPIEAKEL